MTASRIGGTSILVSQVRTRGKYTHQEEQIGFAQLIFMFGFVCLLQTLLDCHASKKHETCKNLEQSVQNCIGNRTLGPTKGGGNDGRAYSVDGYPKKGGAQTSFPVLQIFRSKLHRALRSEPFFSILLRMERPRLWL